MNPVGGSIVFYLVDGKPVCCKCVPENHENNPIPVQRENVHPYSQECSRCYNRCYVGAHTGNMFPVEYDKFVMNESIYTEYRRLFVECLPHNKPRAREIQVEFLERCLKAKVKGKNFLTDAQIIEAIDRFK